MKTMKGRRIIKKTSIFFAIVLVALTAFQTASAACPSSNAATTCGDCLSADGCNAWSSDVGECFESCQFAPMDTACYSLREDATASVESVCGAASQRETERALCGSRSDCSTCVGTSLADDGSSRACQWFPSYDGEGGYCDSECGMYGCGETVCSEDVDVVAIDEDPGVAVDDAVACETKSSCRECLETKSCDWTGENYFGCVDSCDMIADAPCYSFDYFGGGNPGGGVEDVPGVLIITNGDDNEDETWTSTTTTTTTNAVVTADEICAIADDDKNDSDLCSGQNDCDSCVSSILSDGVTSCQWFSDGGYCGSGCGMFGCGDSTCSQQPQPSIEEEASTTTTVTTTPPPRSCRPDYSVPEEERDESSLTCSGCLSKSCAWSPVAGCLDSCQQIADVDCYDTQTAGVVGALPTPEGVQSVCDRSETNEADGNLCGNLGDCGSCVGTILSDGIGTCQWNDGLKACSSGCTMAGCGSTVCNNDDAGGDKKKETKPPLLTIDEAEAAASSSPEIVLSSEESSSSSSSSSAATTEEASSASSVTIIRASDDEEEKNDAASGNNNAMTTTTPITADDNNNDDKKDDAGDDNDVSMTIEETVPIPDSSSAGSNNALGDARTVFFLSSALWWFFLFFLLFWDDATFSASYY